MNLRKINLMSVLQAILFLIIGFGIGMAATYRIFLKILIEHNVIV